jgi:hypothetical protein
MKYVMFKDDTYIIIPENMRHSDLLPIDKPIHSAGFVKFATYEDNFGREYVRVQCYGNSFTLGKSCDKEHDEDIISLHFM